MLVTKHAAELCALLVNDLYGELPSRILVALFTKGRSTLVQLGHYTSVAPRYLRNALSVLIQQNLLYHSPDADGKTTYEVNAAACYEIVRFGKILQVVETQYGTAERDLVQTLLMLGFASVADLTQAYRSRQPQTNGTNGHTNGSHESASGLIESDDQLQLVLVRLIQAQVVETVHPSSFRNPQEVFREIEKELTQAAPGEKSSTKIRSEQQDNIAERFKKYRDEPKSLKRELDLMGTAPKRRKLQNGYAKSFDEHVPQIRPNAVVRVNHERCLVELRNQRLATFASDTLGSVTGQVYHALLDLLMDDVPRCRGEVLIEEDTPGLNMAVSTLDLLQHIDEGVDLQTGIGKTPKEKIDVPSAERVRDTAEDSDSEADDSDFEPSSRRVSVKRIDMVHDELDDSEDGGETNGDRGTRVKFEDGSTSKTRRIDGLRQHLMLLAESKPRFVRHCAPQGRGMWTVDIDRVLSALRESELDSYIEQSFGRHGLRLTRILREKGKLDEKMLPSAALMKKSDVQLKMTAMQMAGLVDVQEVPKDNSRLANRSLFFWYFDRERIEARLVDDVYKTMVRNLQTLQVERHKERHILSFVDRKDVKGKEEEVMTAEHYNKYNRHLEVQDKLLGQMMRLDDMITIIREF